MSTVVIEHVPLVDLPAAWRSRFAGLASAQVTVRIDEELETEAVQNVSNNPMFGMWADRADMADVGQFAEELRAPRLSRKD